jgi:hypothetical protein
MAQIKQRITLDGAEDVAALVERGNAGRLGFFDQRSKGIPEQHSALRAPARLNFRKFRRRPLAGRIRRNDRWR